jgi:hypothetical protein
MTSYKDKWEANAFPQAERTSHKASRMCCPFFGNMAAWFFDFKME